MNEHLQQQSALNPQPVLPILTESGEDWRETIMARLKAAAEETDGAAFQSAYRDLDSEELSAEDYIQVIRLALEVGAYLLSREVSTLAANRYSENAELQKYARILAPAKVIGSSPATGQSIEVNRNWMKSHGAEYRGQWVAILDGQLLGAAKSLDELIATVGRRKDALLTIAR
ncbi:MAG: hypothetical protein ABI977_19730 [Acidobacteriota bacterium]